VSKHLSIGSNLASPETRSRDGIDQHVGEALGKSVRVLRVAVVQALFRSGTSSRIVPWDSPATLGRADALLA
jgi:hypothetical protein